MIEGVIIKKLDRIIDERGSVMHMLKVTDPEFKQFGEIYFSTAYPNIIKGWHVHKLMTLNYAVVKGNIKLVLFDDREDSPTKGEIQQVFIGDKNYCLVSIPPGVFNGYKCIGVEEAIVANCSTHPHSTDEIERLDPFTDRITYNWDIKYE
jgi:dTDP-4-dehydrorhamnose 3,5-epimerase